MPASDRVLDAVQELSDALDRMYTAVRDDMDTRPTDLAALRMLAIRERRGETVTPLALARHLGITTASATVLLDRLTEQGHVRRDPHPEDRRSRVVSLTPHARASFFAHFGPRLGTMRGVADGYDEADLLLVARFMQDLASAIVRPTDGNTDE